MIAWCEVPPHDPCISWLQAPVVALYDWLFTREASCSIPFQPFSVFSPDVRVEGSDWKFVYGSLQ